MRANPTPQPEPPWRRGVNVRQQSKGPPYARCPICRRPVAGRPSKGATEYQVQFVLAVALAEHRRAEHSETKDED